MQFAADSIRQLEQLAAQGLTGIRSSTSNSHYPDGDLADDEHEPSTITGTRGSTSASPLRIWIPATMLEVSVPEILRTHSTQRTPTKHTVPAIAAAKHADGKHTDDNAVPARSQHQVSPRKIKAGDARRASAAPSVAPKSTADVLLILSGDDEPVVVRNGVIDLT